MVAKDSKTRNLVCSADNCFYNCHVNCDCWWTGLTVWFCKRFSASGKCSECSLYRGDHYICKLLFEEVTEEIISPDEDRIAQREQLEKKKLIVIRQ